LAASVGIACGKLLAKIASDDAKPLMYVRTHRVSAPSPGTCNTVGLADGDKKARRRHAAGIMDVQKDRSFARWKCFNRKVAFLRRCTSGQRIQGWSGRRSK
jgi:hypothetical protein